MICETGPDFQKPIDSNHLETILRSYAKYMEHKHLPGLLRIFSSYSPTNVFADVIETALHSCERNRKTMLLLFLVRSSYERPEVASLFTRFRAVVEECRNSKIAVAAVLTDDDPRKEFLQEIIAVSEQRRLQILNAIKAGDMYEACDLMLNTIEGAYSNSPASENLAHVFTTLLSPKSTVPRP